MFKMVKVKKSPGATGNYRAKLTGEGNSALIYNLGKGHSVLFSGV